MAANQVTLMQQLHEEHATALWGYCLHLTGGDREVAEDLLQETLLRACRRFSTREVGTGSVRAWLFTVARNLRIDEWRRRRSRVEYAVAEVPEGGDRADRTDELLQSWVVAEALSRLSEDHRAVLRECYYAGCSVAEAARRLEIPEGTVKSRTHYALHALRQALEELGVVGG